ncbi:MAG TPA: helix-turn-helix domain-containing protein [Pseudonocardiaceae bacterium]|jgi:AcrR family transcriptional regulator|nr:helix-turn-helix domain-containing protein [Pseudonocardiaceae bacterium]
MVNRRVAGRGLHRVRTETTRALLLDTAERLFAEHGFAAVSVRQVLDAARQANKSAVAYHFGTKTDLILAISRAHAEPMERRRQQLLRDAEGSARLRDHVGCLVRPFTEHLAELGNPSWCARFAALVTAEPGLRDVVVWENTGSPAMRATITAIRALTPQVPLSVALVRDQMVRSALVHTCAERELALSRHEDVDTAASWAQTGDALVDAVVGLISAPVHV